MPSGDKLSVTVFADGMTVTRMVCHSPSLRPPSEATISLLEAPVAVSSVSLRLPEALRLSRKRSLLSPT